MKEIKTIIVFNWLTDWIEKISLWGAADLRNFSIPRAETGQKFPFALSCIISMNPRVMVSIKDGPNAAYADEYAKVNNHIDELSEALAAEIKVRGFRSEPRAASKRTDTVNIKGDFAHKTAATRVGLGWIGLHCQLITRLFGPWIRLGTVFTDMELPLWAANREKLVRSLYTLRGSMPCKSIEMQCMVSGIAA
ncbi:MAG: epoxyqueuosine reductase [Dissulfurispiraceae bacterium]